MNRTALANGISLSRIPLSICFLLVFEPDADLLRWAVVVIGLIFLSDVIDGTVSRRKGKPTRNGRLYDALGDKAFYLAAVVNLVYFDVLNQVIAWCLIFREVSLYIFRIMYIENYDSIFLKRWHTNLHGYFMYGMILFGFVLFFVKTGESDSILGISSGFAMIMINVTATCAGVFGFLSIFVVFKTSREVQ